MPLLAKHPFGFPYRPPGAKVPQLALAIVLGLRSPVAKESKVPKLSDPIFSPTSNGVKA